MSAPEEKKAGPGRIELAPAVCPGTGKAALRDERRGFYGCSACGVILGVILLQDHLVPAHAPDTMPVVDEGQRYTLRPEHEPFAMLHSAAGAGMSKDMVIDLLVRELILMTRRVQQAKQAAPPRIIVPS